jgi:hypothetical protein
MSVFTPIEKLDLRTADGIAEMEMRVLCSLDGDIRNFHVALEQKGLVLRGQARTYHARQFAHDLVLEASDLPILDNEIEVW